MVRLVHWPGTKSYPLHDHPPPFFGARRTVRVLLHLSVLYIDVGPARIPSYMDVLCTVMFARVMSDLLFGKDV